MSVNKGKSALIAMSGGVDSSVAAYLMMEKGYYCEGTTMRLYRNEEIGLNQFHTCCSQRDIEDASEVAFQLDIPYEVLDFTMDFKEKIIGKFIRTYEAGGTPNPCIDCNRYMKFDKLLRFAEEKGLEYVVTGHYSRIEYDRSSGRYLLKKALDPSKDQSYVLYMLTQEQLAHIQFPLGWKTKTEVRALAQRLGFCNAHKHDSQDICFVPNGDYVQFMEQYTGKHYPEGDFLDLEGQPVGRHCGAVRYTLGQRKELRLALGEPVYVCGKDMAANTVTVGPERALYCRTLLADDMNWISIPSLEKPMRIKAKTRYRQVEQWATAYPEQNGCVRLVFEEPQRAVTIGQAVVLYHGDIVVGGGTISQAPAQMTAQKDDWNCLTNLGGGDA
ncbi:MAG: tRNA 2-thiouridine(34) synthase MnmA [Bacillota bacterium]|nr:tRNA 2-thiouridine(34) synthase MnmA [Bacillota bacterium]